MCEIIIIVELAFLIGLLVCIVKQLHRTHRMQHDHVHGITNYLAESTSELRTMRISAGMLPVKDDAEEKDHGHHHS